MAVAELTLTPLQWGIAALLAGSLIVVHLIAGRVAGWQDSAQQRLASLGGGVAVAYVFIQALPELAEGGQSLTDLAIAPLVPTPIVESGLFLVALLGMALVYSLDVVGTAHRGGSRLPYWMHLVAFAGVSALYAYTMPSLLTTGVGYAVLLTIALAAHALIEDRTLARAHPGHFRHRDRWVGILGVVVGFACAVALPPASELVLAVTTALLAGGLLMTTFREELPAASKARLPWFLAGATGMTLLLLGAHWAGQ